MKKMLMPALALLLAASAAQGAVAECASPVFPVQSTSSESVRRVEKQVGQWRECQAERTAVQDPALTIAQDNEVDAAMQKWANATRLYAKGQAVGGQTQISIERDQSEHLLSRLSPMPAVYGSERK